MKKKLLFLGVLLPFLIASCSSGGESFSSSSISSESSSSSEVSSSSESSSTSTSEPSQESSEMSSQSISESSSEETIAVTSVSLNKTTLEINTDTVSTSLTATVSPSTATNKEVIWTSSDDSVAIVDNGKVTPIGAGSCDITVETVDGNKTATCKLTVKQVIKIPDYVIHIKRYGETEWDDVSISFNQSTTSEYYIQGLSLDEGDVFKVHMYGNTWYGYSALKDSTPPNLVAAASSDDNIKVLKTGIYDIYCDYNKFDNGYIYLDKVGGGSTPSEVSVTGVSLDRSAKFLQYREEIVLNATVYPSTVTNKELKWESSDTSIATVTKAGRVVAQSKKGTAVITVKTLDGNKTDTCIIYSSPSAYADYCLTGTVNGTKRLYSATTSLKAVPVGDGSYIIPNVQLKAGDKLTVTDDHGVTLKARYNQLYSYDVTYTEKVDIYLYPKDSGYNYLTLVNKNYREIYVKYPDNTNDSNLCAWLWVSGPDITPVWVKSNDLSLNSTGSKFMIPKKATQFTFFRGSQNAKPKDGDYSSIGTTYRTIGPKTLSDNVTTYDCNI